MKFFATADNFWKAINLSWIWRSKCEHLFILFHNVRARSHSTKLKDNSLKLKENIIIKHIINVLNSPPQNNNVIAADRKSIHLMKNCYTRQNIKIHFHRCKAIRVLLDRSDVMTNQIKQGNESKIIPYIPQFNLHCYHNYYTKRIMHHNSNSDDFNFYHAYLSQGAPSLYGYSFSENNMYTWGFSFSSAVYISLVKIWK